ncbi:hypothetical protein BJY24_003131 [Nocardia transvalensis]|uniref:Uncharacterized protein n=2 Tax=Nocardia transvalensis TaxID=37333 RepID=A0A7W9PEN6_9NOCA|nr:hypothetical protein [Nocardia transvalensis]MBB5914264.1 hypothetical protein [Nocardia transvalensis]
MTMNGYYGGYPQQNQPPPQGYYPPPPMGYQGYPPPPRPPQRDSRAGLIIVCVFVAITLIGFALVVVYNTGLLSPKTDPEQLVMPLVGQCTDASEIVIHGPIKVVDCALPTATKKIVTSEIVSGGGKPVECPDPQILVITDGYRDGQYTVAHSCAAPNLTIGNCYEKIGSSYNYDATCASSSGRLDRKLPGVTDTKVCDTSAEGDYVGKIAFTTVQHFHYVDQKEGATYCFVPVG